MLPVVELVVLSSLPLCSSVVPLKRSLTLFADHFDSLIQLDLLGFTALSMFFHLYDIYEVKK